jgi:hypothetical protein
MEIFNNSRRITIYDLTLLLEAFLAGEIHFDVIPESWGVIKIDNDYGTIFYTPKNDKIKLFSIYKENKCFKALNIIGGIDIKLDELRMEFEEMDMFFTSRDELFYYVFTFKDKLIVSTTFDKEVKGNVVLDNIDVSIK